MFVEKTSGDCLFDLSKDTTPPNFAEKTFANSHKSSKFVKVPCCTVFSGVGQWAGQLASFPGSSAWDRGY